MSTQTRADASRNRETLIAVATQAFAASGSEPSMRAIARQAGVGVGTLYRHFPTRESLVEAVYRDQLKRLTEGAHDLIGKYPPAEAMRRWMDLFAHWVATKRGMTETLHVMLSTGDISPTQSRTELLDAIELILDSGRRTDQIRPDATAEDVATALAGTFMAAASPAQATRLLDLLMDALRARAS